MASDSQKIHVFPNTCQILFSLSDVFTGKKCSALASYIVVSDESFRVDFGRITLYALSLRTMGTNSVRYPQRLMLTLLKTVYCSCVIFWHAFLKALQEMRLFVDNCILSNFSRAHTLRYINIVKFRITFSTTVVYGCYSVLIYS